MKLTRLFTNLKKCFLPSPNPTNYLKKMEILQRDFYIQFLGSTVLFVMNLLMQNKCKIRQN